MFRVQTGASDFRQSGDEQRRVVQRLGPPKTHSLLLGELLESNVDVVQHFNVITNKADRLNENA